MRQSSIRSQHGHKVLETPRTSIRIIQDVSNSVVIAFNNNTQRFKSAEITPKGSRAQSKYVYIWIYVWVYV
jgi:hypothetical protein